MSAAARPPHRRSAVTTAALLALTAAAATAIGCAPAGPDGSADDSIDEVVAAQVAPLGRNHPSTVPGDFLLTPMGYFHPSCIRSAAERALAAATPCAYPHFDKSGRAIGDAAATSDGGPHLGPLFRGGNWITNANATVSGVGRANRIRITGDVRVPAAPAFAGGQTLYIFNGLEPSANGSEILQPVLGWSGGRWTMQNWDCCVGGSVFNDGAVAVKPGDLINQSVAGSTNSGFNIAWNRNGGRFKVFTVDGNNQVYDWAFAAVLEAYDIDRCDQYPNDGATTFTNVAVTVNGAARNPAWHAAAPRLSPDCATNTTFGGGTFALHYRSR
jgi:hypothetical protein